MGWVTLDGYAVVETTLGALLLEKEGDRIWVPRKVVMDGDIIEKGDTDLTVKARFAERVGLE